MGPGTHWRAPAVELRGGVVMYRRAQNPRAAKAHRCYDVDQMMKLYDCHRNTVYNWVDAGLRPIDDKYPRLFHGSALNAFHGDRRRERKRPCGPGQVYCLVCRTPKMPVGGMVDYQPKTTTTGTIIAICPDCDRIIRRIVGSAQLVEFQELWSVNVPSDKHT